MNKLSMSIYKENKSHLYKYNTTIKGAEISDSNFFNLDVRDGEIVRSIYIPVEKDLIYKIYSRNKFIIIEKNNKLHKANVSIFRFILEYIKNSLHKRNRTITFDGILITVSGPRSSRMMFYKFLTEIRKSSAEGNLGGLLIPQLALGWPEADNQGIKYNNNLIIVCHLYYIELIKEISSLIRNSILNCDVLITISPEKKQYIKTIKYFLPNAKIVICENIGRDVYPFLKIMKDELLDGYDLICKIHGKKSKTGGRFEASGDWRRRLLFLDLLGSRPTLDRTFSIFAANPKVGMIESRAFRCPGPVFSESMGWHTNRERLLDLVARMGVKPDHYKPDFFAGTMFWVRREALEPLRRLCLDVSYFKPEEGDLRDAPEHALERAFGASVELAGFKMVNIDATECDPELREIQSSFTIT